MIGGRLLRQGRGVLLSASQQLTVLRGRYETRALNVVLRLYTRSLDVVYSGLRREGSWTPDMVPVARHASSVVLSLPSLAPGHSVYPLEFPSLRHVGHGTGKSINVVLRSKHDIGAVDSRDFAGGSCSFPAFYPLWAAQGERLIGPSANHHVGVFSVHTQHAAQVATVTSVGTPLDARSG